MAVQVHNLLLCLFELRVVGICPVAHVLLLGNFLARFLLRLILFHLLLHIIFLFLLPSRERVLLVED